MTGTQISGVGQSLMSIGVSMSRNQQDAGSIVSFSDYMKTNLSEAQNKVTDTGVESFSTKDYVSKKDIPKKMSDKAVGSKTTVENDALKDEVQDELSSKAEQFVEEIAKELGVTKEEIELAMQNLDITPLMLLQPEMLTELVVEVAGEGELLSLVTNGELLDSLNTLLGQVQDIFSQVQEELSLSPEQLQDLMQEVLKTEEVTLETVVQSENIIVDGNELSENEVSDENTTTLSDKTMENLLNVSKKEIQLAETKEVTDQIEITDEDQTMLSSEKLQTSNEEATTSGGQDGKENQFSGQNDPKLLNGQLEKETNSKNNTEGNQGFLQNQINTLNGNTNTTMTQPVATYTATTPAQQISDQMIEYIKMNVSPGVTEMEIQLQPASLGNINLQLTLRNGAVTAQFIAQNEEVKNAIEQQVVQLKTTLEEQGVKIEAVEVTIASHEFERAMEQGGQWQNDEREEQAADTTRNRRRVVLSELEDEEELSTEEILQVQMMKQNGTTIELEA